MKTSFIQHYVLFLILIGCRVLTALNISRECLVRNNIEIDLLVTPFFSFDFKAFFGNDISKFGILLKCSENSEQNYDLIDVSPQKISYSRNRRIDKETSINVTTITQGWHDFQLSFTKNVTLVNEGNIWLNEAADCNYKSIELQDGNFTESCYPHTPVWEIDTVHGLEISLPKDQSLWCQEMIMFSKLPFSPWLRTYTNIERQIKDYSMEYPIGNFEPLMEHMITFEVEEDHRLLKVKNGKTVIEGIQMNQELLTLKLYSRDGNIFTVVQNTCVDVPNLEGTESVTEIVHCEELTEALPLAALTCTVHYAIESVLMGIMMVLIGILAYVAIRSKKV
ncbi:unnamed protein product, partial [Meganyctiphanes norvegica]